MAVTSLSVVERRGAPDGKPSGTGCGIEARLRPSPPGLLTPLEMSGDEQAPKKTARAGAPMAGTPGAGLRR